MSPGRPIRLLLCLLLIPFAAAGAQQAEPSSPRNASYEIDVTLDPEGRMLEGRQILEWRNIQEVSTDELWFHLYWNAWRGNRSTWMLEDRVRDRSDRRGKEKDEDYGWIQVDSVRLLGDPSADGRDQEIELTTRYASPDDGNPDDRTVLVVALPRTVEPGETIRVALTWKARIPRTFARTGYRGDFYFFAHWFPKLGVLEPAGWNCHQFHAATEFYSDYGAYVVRMTVPAAYVVGATGLEDEQIENSDGTVTHQYSQNDVHGFAWTTSPHYDVIEERFEMAGLPPVELRLLMQPEHLGQAERHLAASRAALESYGTWYGPYPYGHVTIVDPAYGSGAGGMEYPTLFTCGTRRFNPPGGDSPEGVTVHEMGHQFWYGLVGNNEFEHAWIDEGLNTFSTIRTLEHAYDPRILVRRYLDGFVPLRFPEIEVSRWNRRLNQMRRAGSSDMPGKPTYHYFPGTAGVITYSKTALWLATLERHLGWETLREILSTFHESYRFEHPLPADFFAVADEVAGQDLSWFFDQVHGDSVAFDYAVTRAKSTRVRTRGWVEQQGELVLMDTDEDEDEDADDDSDDAEGDDEEKVYRTEVVVNRLGDGRFPVDVLMVFEDGEEVRETWDGRDRWKMFVEERPSRLEYAEVDPDRVLMLDPVRTNNSRMRKSQAKLPARSWGTKWMLWFQDRLSGFAFYM